jgi:hypothetical protein
MFTHWKINPTQMTLASNFQSTPTTVSSNQKQLEKIENEQANEFQILHPSSGLRNDFLAAKRS